MNKIDFLNKIDELSSNLEQAEEFGQSKDIYWFSNNIEKGETVKFNGLQITDYFLNDEYGKITRWDLWNECAEYLSKELKCKSLLDIGGANGHFSFLCLLRNIDAYAVEPRFDMIQSTEDEFITNFGSKKVFRGNIKTLLEVLVGYKEQLDFKFDCINILNFLHGPSHKLEDIECLVENLPKITEYILVSDPNWTSLNSPNLFENFKLIKSFGYENLHKLYKL
jgi:hypothetical protein